MLSTKRRSLEALAERAGIDRNTPAKLEGNPSPAPSVLTLQRHAATVGLELCWELHPASNPLYPQCPSGGASARAIRNICNRKVAYKGCAAVPYRMSRTG